MQHRQVADRVAAAVAEFHQRIGFGGAQMTLSGLVFGDFLRQFLARGSQLFGVLQVDCLKIDSCDGDRIRQLGTCFALFELAAPPSTGR